MKINVTKFSLTLLAALTLAACGSGGGSEPSKQNPSQVQPQPQPEPDKSKAEPSGNDGDKEPPKPDTSKKDPSGNDGDKELPKPDTSKKDPSGNDGDKELPKPDTSKKDPSGNDGDKEPPKTQPTPQINNATDATISGESYPLDRSGSNVYPLPVTSFNGKDINFLNIDGKQVQIISENVRDGEIHLNNDGNIHRSVAGFENTSWGYISDLNNQFGHDYVFAIGHNATKMEDLPEGSATYSGNAIHITGNSTDAGKTNLNVNFADKSVEGKITFPQLNEHGVELKATISGNGFEGVSQDGTLTKGGFYGDKAQELIGTYQSEDPNKWYIGAYGAKKDTDK